MSLSVISPTWILFAVLPALSIYWLWIRLRPSYARYNIPPFPVMPWPFFGHFFLTLGNLRDRIKEWRKKAGSIFSIDIAGQHHILVNDFADIKEIWTKHAEVIVNRQHNFIDEILDELNTGFFSGRDENWKAQRTTCLSILRSFGMGKNTMAEKIQEEVAVTIEKLASFNEQPHDVRLLLNISVSNVICSVVVGRRFDHEDKYFARLVLQLRIFLKYVNKMLFLTPVKQLFYLPGDLFNARELLKATFEITEDFAKPYLNKLKKECNENEEPQNLVTAYLGEMKKEQIKGTSGWLNEKNLLVIVRTLFVAGTETTSITILWCLLYMLHNPRVQEKVYQEILVHVGTERAPNITDRPKLTYLNAVIMETQRMASLLPVASRREISATFEYGCYTFPKDSIIWPVLDSVHHDKKIWGDPEVFRPERFIDNNGGLITREELIPFGYGRRVCLGESLARMELFLFLSSMFQRFRFEPEDKSARLPTLKGSFGTTVVPQPFKLRFIDRKAID